MRGEQVTEHDLDMNAPGSSPHARGTDASNVGVGKPKGIIPACAGTSQQLKTSIAETRDHPRMRGEQC